MNKPRDHTKRTRIGYLLNRIKREIYRKYERKAWDEGWEKDYKIDRRTLISKEIGCLTTTRRCP